MRIAVAGAGKVGRSIARELLVNGHDVLLVDRDPAAIKVQSVPEAEWLLADACELSSLEEAGLQRCHVVVAATGDDKANLVVSLLAKTEYGVPRTVARVAMGLPLFAVAAFLSWLILRRVPLAKAPKPVEPVEPPEPAEPAEAAEPQP